MTTTTPRYNSQPSAGQFGLRNLVALLRNEGHRTLNGVSAFTLTTSVLQQLNIECRRHSLAERGESETDKETDKSDVKKERSHISASRRDDQKMGDQKAEPKEWHYNIQFVKDFMQFSPNLKLGCDGDVSASPISLRRFSNLTSLNLQRVPVQRLQGLQLLRNTLITITVYKGLDAVKDLLEFCGGDMSAPLSWPHLKFVSLVFNSLTELDDSLRLVPHVQVLDLSHNLLQKCDQFLEYLVDVRHISLAYNDLTQVPRLSATTGASLTCLVLRGNNLDSLQGIEELTSLQQLDLGDNCISKHKLLESLSSLLQLKELQVDGNPISYHRLHRPLTASCLARQVANVKFELDRKKLTASEIYYFSRVKARLVSSATDYDVSKKGQESSRNPTSRDGEAGSIPPAAVLCDPDRKDAQVKADPETSNQRRKSRYKKGRPRDTRIVDINDTDDSHNYHIVRPGSAPFPKHLEKLMADRRLEAMQTRREIEELRKHYGHNWLQAIEDRGIFNKRLEPAGDASPTPQHKCTINNGHIVGQDSLASSSSKVSQATTSGTEFNAQSVVKGEVGSTEIPSVMEASFTDSNKPFMATIARLAAGLPERFDRADMSAHTGSADPDVIRASTGTAHSTPPVGTENDRTAARAGYTHHSVPDKADRESPIVQAQNRKSDQNMEDVGGSLVHDSNSKHDSNKQTASTLQVENLKPDADKEDTKSPTTNVGDSKLDQNQKDTGDCVPQPVKTISWPDKELTDKQNEASTRQVMTYLANTAQLPDVVPTRQQVQVHTHQNHVTATVRSDDNLLPYKETTPAYKSSPYVSVTPGKGGHTAEFAGRRDSTGEDKEVIEPMLVNCPLQDNEVILLTMTSQYLVEKNFRDKVTEKLELTSLNHMDWTWLDTPHNKQPTLVLDRRQTGGGGDGQMSKDTRTGKSRGGVGKGDGSIQVDLRFDYLRKDKQSRCYILDVPDGNLLVSRLQPFLDIRDSQLKAAVKTVLQCLKCNTILPQTETDQPRNSGKTLQSALTSGDVPDITQLCPKCGSSVIIELASTGGAAGAHTHKRRKSQTPTMSGSSSKNKTTIPLVKKVFDRITSQSTFNRKSRAERISTQVQSSLAAATAAQKISSSLTSRKYVSTTLDKNLAGDLSGTADKGLVDDQSGRDRSSAFRAPGNMVRAVVEMEDRDQIRDNLVCVEDYFSADLVGPITSCHLAEITSSLRRDSPNRTKKQAKQTSSSVSPHTEYMSRSLSGFESRNQLSQSCVDGAMFDRDGSLQRHEYPSSPIRIEGVGSTRGVPWKLRQHQGEGAGDKFGTGDRDAFVRAPDWQDEQGRSRSVLHTKTSDRRVSVPALATSLGGQNPSVDSSMGRRRAHGFIKRSEANFSSEASPKSSSDLPRQVQNPAMVCSSVPKFVSYLLEREVRAGKVTVASGDASPVFHSSLHSSLSSDQSDPCELSESPSVNGIHKSANGSVMPVGDLHTSDDGAALMASAGDRIHGELQEDIGSIYDFSDEPKHSRRVGDVLTDSSMPYMSSDDNICQFEEPAGCLDNLNINLQGFHFPTKDCLSVEETPDNHQLSNTIETDEAAAGGGTEEEADVEDESNDDELVPSYGFHHLNHRLTLFLMMSLFGTDEEFLCKIQCPIVQYIIAEPYEGMLVMSSHRFYVLKFTSEDHRQPPDQWIQCVEIQPIPELRYIDVGLGGQSLRLEFITDCSSFSLITGNRDKTVQFVEVLHGHLTSYATRQGINSTVVVNEDTDQSTVNNLDRDVVSQVTPGQRLLYYCMGFLESGQGERSPVSVVVTSSEICLVRANHQWPQPRLQGPITVETVGKQFTVLERQRINNVASLKVCPVSMRKVSLELFSAGGGQSSCWNITLASRRSTGDLIHAISGPWAEEFGVGMEVTHVKLDF